MNLKFLGGAGRIAAIGAILLGSASCIYVDETLGKNFIPTDQKWNVYTPEPVALTGIRMQMADSLSGYSTTRFTFGSVNDDLGTCMKSASFTLVPVMDTLDFGKNTKIRGFHFMAAKDTVSAASESQMKILQNVYVSELKAPLDSNVLYASSFMDPEFRDKYLDLTNIVTDGIPVYAGGDSLSFEFSREFTESFISRLKKADLDSMDLYLKDLPGFYITTDAPAGQGGRINMFKVGMSKNDSGYLSGNYAELKITADYGDRKDVDTSFVFLFGLGDFFKNLSSTSDITQFAFNSSEHESAKEYSKDGVLATDKIRIEGGCGIKPVVKASEIKDILDAQLAQAGISDYREVVINKATILLPYSVDEYSALDTYPMILSPTVRLRSTEGKYVSYAGLTDSSIASENQGDINRSLGMYTPDISHHVQEILKLDRNDPEFSEKIGNYDIWFLIMHTETTQTNSNNSMNDYYNNLMYNSYYNNMMYNPYGYGGYGYGGYGYGSYGYGGYGYGNNYYNYMMMAMYASASSGSNEKTTTEMDKDRYYKANLNGPDAVTGAVPQLRITFSAPKTAE